jgi:hypothetical protein
MMAKRLRAAAEGCAVRGESSADLLNLAKWCDGLAKYPKILSAIGRREFHKKWGRTDDIAWHATILERLAKKPQWTKERHLTPQQEVADHWGVSRRTVTDALTDRRFGNDLFLDELIEDGWRCGGYSEMEVLVGEAQLAADRLKQWNNERELARAQMRKYGKAKRRKN